jgi:hypothetical protein
MLTFEKRVDSKKLFSSPWLQYFFAQSPYNPLTENYTKIFYRIRISEGDIPFIHCQMSLGGA